jgi:hypothetical protein
MQVFSEFVHQLDCRRIVSYRAADEQSSVSRSSSAGKFERTAAGRFTCATPRKGFRWAFGELWQWLCFERCAESLISGCLLWFFGHLSFLL